MKHLKERELIVDYGKKLITEKLTTGTGGNISIYLPEEEAMLISPSGIPYFETEPEDIGPSWQCVGEQS
jgi:L-fuculose-phosphate aldolase